MTAVQRSLNYRVLQIFGPLLILTGIAGFVLPPAISLTSGAPAYNVFHIAFGLVGSALVWHGEDRLIRLFNAGFGAIDLYQAAASWLHLFPEKHFVWKPADDLLHVLIGAGLVLVALVAPRPVRR